ncbi:phosphatidylinositol-specific phospholipase C/glycerophosphodiester phosphodiesterase family protein [Streptomyces physcomitrii]|uniref:phosphatidylinositol-specific phospholipase C/glycerophosphodiester phosphodiesterase family protein n=1 Tax=Streptomyces physcomitrii TaxID=2724184 RepID=UPI003428A542
MPLTTRRRALTALGAATAAGVAAPVLFGGPLAPAARAASATGGHRPRPHWRAHAHNDYEHPRPLLDALDQRFGSVEADIYLVEGELLVAHDPVDLDPQRTLESLYLRPLRERVRANHGWVYGGRPRPLQLLVDLKTEGASTYLALDRVLRRYPELFTGFRHGRVRRRAVTVVVSGDRAAREPMAAQDTRLAFYDGRLTDLGTAADASIIPLISDNWALNFGWQGTGPFPAAERQKLRTLVAGAHARGQQLRLWSTPDLPGPAREALWGELLAEGVDFLNTDDLAGLAAFLTAHGA